jgi:hypothetical protein
VGPTWQRRDRGNAIDELRKLKEEVPFGKYAKAAQAEWAEWTECAHDDLRGWAGWAGIEGKIISE